MLALVRAQAFDYGCTELLPGGLPCQDNELGLQRLLGVARAQEVGDVFDHAALMQPAVYGARNELALEFLLDPP